MNHVPKPQKHLSNLIKQLHVEGHAPKFVLFLGAGSSVTSGIPGAQELVAGWREAYSEIHGKDHESKGMSDEYSRLFEALYDKPYQRRECIERLVVKASPSWGHIYLVNLLKRGVFNTIFTTNFDDLVNEACNQFAPGLRPVVCAHDSSVKYVRITSSRPKIIKLHGDFLFDDIKNTVGELAALEENTKGKFEQFASEFGFIFLGYSGNDRSVMDVLSLLVRSPGCFPCGIYWCMRKGEVLSPSLEALVKYAHVTLIEVEGFDEFCAELHSELGLQLQDELRDPYKCLTARLNSLIQVASVKGSDEPAYVNHHVIKKHLRELAEHVTSVNQRRDVVPRLLVAQIAFSNGNYQDAFRYSMDEIQESFSTIAMKICFYSAAKLQDHRKIEEFVSKLQDWVRRMDASTPPSVLHDFVVTLIRSKEYNLALGVLSVGEVNFGPGTFFHDYYNWEFHLINKAQIFKHQGNTMPPELKVEMERIALRADNPLLCFGALLTLGRSDEAVQCARVASVNSKNFFQDFQHVLSWPISGFLGGSGRKELEAILSAHSNKVVAG